MDVLLVVVGGLLVGSVLVEVMITVLHPEAGGPITTRIEHGVWRLVGGANRRLGLDLHAAGGPAALAAGVGWWAVALWFGFGLVWLGASDSLAIASTGILDDRINLADALYYSGSILTTIGFGDIVASTDLARLLSIVEGGMGLVVLTALISYVLSVYPLVTNKRAVADRLRDLGADEPEGVLELVFGLGAPELRRLHHDLIEVGHGHARFQVLYYFHSSARNEDLEPLVRSAALAITALSLCDHDGDPAAGGLAPYRNSLARSLRRFTERTVADYGISGGQPPSRSESAAALEELHERARSRWGERILAEVPSEEILAEVEEIDRYLADLARIHGDELRPLLGKARG